LNEPEASFGTIHGKIGLTVNHVDAVKNLSCYSLQLCNDCDEVDEPRRHYRGIEVERPQLGGAGCGHPFPQ
jgi:hypothetical protein